MKLTRTLLTAAAAAALITASAVSAFAQSNNIIVLDENGNGFFNGTRLQYTIDPDPYSHITTLHYFLPFVGFTNPPGDLVLIEGNGLNGPISDILRFNGTGSVWFFSEMETNDLPPFDLADVPVLPPTMSNVVRILEVGAEGANGATYIPLPGQPGWDQFFVFRYEIISDVPEPATCMLAGLGFLLVAMKVRARRR